MKWALLISASLLLMAPAGPPEIAPRYFTHVREIRVPVVPGKQPYAVVDEAMWNASEKFLHDTRIYDGGREIPYSMVTKGARGGPADTSARILNKGIRNGQTEFVIETPLAEFDTVKLEFKRKDFSSRATLAGSDDLPSENWTQLGSYALFDFTQEELGRNWTVRLKSPVRYKYLRVQISESVKPEDVLGASIAYCQSEKAKYTTWSTKPAVQQERGRTVIEWTGSEKVPLEHIQFTVNVSEVNFSRALTLLCKEDAESDVLSRKSARFVRRAIGELTRVKMFPKQRKIEYESLDFSPPESFCKAYRVEIANGDDPPLRLSEILPQTIERRIYFESRGATALKLYYGDKKTDSPAYDFAKFFNEPDDPFAVRAELGPGLENPEYVARADDRPWSERNPALMWTALIVAVLGLGAWAWKGFKS